MLCKVLSFRFVILATSLFCLAIGCDSSPPTVVKDGPDSTLQPGTERSKVKAISDTENLLQALSPNMKQLANSFSSGAELSFLGSDLKCVGLGAGNIPDFSNDHALPAHSFDWPISAADSSSLSTLFAPLLGGSTLQDVQIGAVGSSFPSSDVFEMKTKLEGKFQDDQNRPFGIKGYQTLTWEKKGEWKLTRWQQDKLKVIHADRALFENVTAAAIPDESSRKKLQRSSHQELILDFAEQATKTKGEMAAPRPPYKGFGDWFSSYQYPSVSVLDLDQDGHDDLFVTDRWQSAQLLKNNGDGTYRDVTKESGLVVDDLCNCTYFADFDNDGDSDAFVGISMGPSKFYINNNGTFEIDEDNTKAVEDSRFVVAASIVDINNDGLLDIYLSTYAFGFGPINEWYERATRQKDQLRMLVKCGKQHSTVNRGGPPNIVLMNRGGKFQWAEIDETLQQFRDSYQTGWTDIDDDGDMDAYICNDFAPDVFLRNETPRGDMNRSLSTPRRTSSAALT